MAIRKLKTKIIEISRTGRIKLLKNSWFTAIHGLDTTALQAGTVYSFVIDDSLMVITEVKSSKDSAITSEYVSNLQDQEIARLQSIVDFQREFILTHPDKQLRDNYIYAYENYSDFDKNSVQSEIGYYQNAVRASRETGYPMKQLTQSTSGKAKGFTTYREDCAIERLKQANDPDWIDSYRG